MTILLVKAPHIMAQTWTADGAVGKYILPRDLSDGVNGKYVLQLGVSFEYPVIKVSDVSVVGGLKYLNRYEVQHLHKTYPVYLNTIEYENTLRYMRHYVAVPIQLKNYFKVKGLRSFVTMGLNVQYFFTGIVFENYYNPYKLKGEKRIEVYYNEGFKNSFSLGPMASVGIERGKLQYSLSFINDKYSGQKGSTNTILFNVAYMIPKKTKKDEK